MSTVRTEAGRRLVAAHPELALLTTGRVVNEANEYAVQAVEAEARRDAFAAIETAVTERMRGGVWLSEAAVLDIVKNAREESS